MSSQIRRRSGSLEVLFDASSSVAESEGVESRRKHRFSNQGNYDLNDLFYATLCGEGMIFIQQFPACPRCPILVNTLSVEIAIQISTNFLKLFL